MRKNKVLKYYKKNWVVVSFSIIALSFLFLSWYRSNFKSEIKVISDKQERINLIDSIVRINNETNDIQENCLIYKSIDTFLIYQWNNSSVDYKIINKNPLDIKLFIGTDENIEKEIKIKVVKALMELYSMNIVDTVSINCFAKNPEFFHKYSASINKESFDAILGDSQVDLKEVGLYHHDKFLKRNMPNKIFGKIYNGPKLNRIYFLLNGDYTKKVR